MNLKTAVSNFINNTCDGLDYNEEISENEKETGVYQGKSLRQNQIPYNMQMDNDRRCLSVALDRFLDSGAAKDAFDVYFCFIEMFLTDYDKTSTMIEMLSEYEENASNVVMKHRDHYSHSVYVFALGLALFESNEDYRLIYSDFYNLRNKKDAAHHFIKYWGITSLFHDMGYPFELPYEQVASYFEASKNNRKGKPFVAYHDLDSAKKLSEVSKKKIAGIYGTRDAIFENSDEFFAYALCNRLADTYIFSEKSMKEILENKPAHPEQFNYFMDHAYFSANIVLKSLYEDQEMDMSMADIDALTAIILHNSLYKFSVAFYKNPKLNKPLKCELHPLAYMLMFCDEIQCWDRTAYGRNSRTKLYPMDCEFDFADDGVSATFIFDINEQHKGDAIKEMQANAGEKPEFQAEIDTIVDTDILKLTVDGRWDQRKPGRKKAYLSESNFLHLYYFAVALNGRWMKSKEWDEAKAVGREMEFLTEHTDEFIEAFNKMSLEYKLSNINQAKAFDKYLNVIGGFYTDRPVDFEEITDFDVDDMLKIGPMEHERWLQEHIDMGWGYAPDLTGDERELKRLHMDMISEEELGDGLTPEKALSHYKKLSKEEQDKDVEPMNTMLTLLKLFDGVRIYRLS